MDCALLHHHVDTTIKSFIERGSRAYGTLHDSYEARLRQHLVGSIKLHYSAYLTNIKALKRAQSKFYFLLRYSF